MGIFDRMWNLGRGAVRVRRSSGDERISDAELEAELANVRRAPEKPAAVVPEVAPAAPEEADEPQGPERDADGKIIKTL